MPVLMISYDHNTLGKDYTAFFEAIQNNAKGWCHYLTSTWLVNTDLNETQFAEKLYPHMTTDDRLLIMKVEGIGNGWLPEDAWKWIRQQEQQLPWPMNLGQFRPSSKEPEVKPPSGTARSELVKAQIQLRKTVAELQREMTKRQAAETREELRKTKASLLELLRKEKRK